MREFRPAHFVCQHRAGGGIEHMQGPPVAAAVLHTVEQIFAALRRLPLIERRGGIAGPEIRIKQQARRAIQPTAHEQLRLVLEARVARVEIARAGLHRNAEALEIEQLAQVRGKPVARRQRVEVGAADIVLPCHPVGHFRIGTDVRFQPAVWIGDALADREIAAHLREIGGLTRGPAPFEKRDRSRFLERLDHLIQASRAFDERRRPSPA